MTVYHSGETLKETENKSCLQNLNQKSQCWQAENLNQNLKHFQIQVWNQLEKSFEFKYPPYGSWKDFRVQVLYLCKLRFFWDQTLIQLRKSYKFKHEILISIHKFHKTNFYISSLLQGEVFFLSSNCKPSIQSLIPDSLVLIT